MICPKCSKEMIWGGDHTFEDYDHDGEGIVSNLSCNECDTFVLTYIPSDE